MAMDVILREKRKSLGLTQEQVANALGVTAPAVNKWEKGATCPDLALLPAVARVLKTDPNTLLSFQENLSTKEICIFINELSDHIKKEGMASGFALAMEKTREYSNCAELLHDTALALDGACMMSAVTGEEKAPYLEAVMGLYERAAKCGVPAYTDWANYMLAAKWMELGEDAKAQERLDLLPERNTLDKRGLQAELLLRRGEIAKAGELLERKLMMSLQDQQGTLCRLIRLAAQEGDAATALAVGDCAQKECEAFGLGPYWTRIGPLEAAVATEDVDGSLTALTALLDAAVKPWDIGFSPLFVHLPRGEGPMDFKALILKPLISNLDHAPEYDFLRGNPRFQKLVETYRAECG